MVSVSGNGFREGFEQQSQFNEVYQGIPFILFAFSFFLSSVLGT